MLLLFLRRIMARIIDAVLVADLFDNVNRFMYVDLKLCRCAAQVASWWDYGYQTTAMANRTVIVDNNTWNNTHIATVGRAMSSPERKAWKIFRSLDVDYVFVLFGGFIG